MNKNIIYIVSLILVACSFYGGMKYDQMQVAGMRQARISQFSGGNVFNNGGRIGRNGGGFAIGQILSKDKNSITLQLMSTSTEQSGSTIVFLSSSTTITKTTAGTINDLVVGEEVTVNGVKNPDGSINANSIGLRQKNN